MFEVEIDRLKIIGFIPQQFSSPGDFFYDRFHIIATDFNAKLTKDLVSIHSNPFHLFLLT